MSGNIVVSTVTKAKQSVVCFYRGKMGHMSVKIDFILQSVSNDMHVYELHAYRLNNAHIRHMRTCRVNIKLGRIYLKKIDKGRIYECLPEFFNSLSSETVYDLYCKMIVLYGVGIDINIISTLHDLLHSKQTVFKLILTNNEGTEFVYCD